jgi:hypothetical protein
MVSVLTPLRLLHQMIELKKTSSTSVLASYNDRTFSFGIFESYMKIIFSIGWGCELPVSFSTNLKSRITFFAIYQPGLLSEDADFFKALKI